jgi:hypothetical protein
MKTWSAENAEVQFGKILDACMTAGPQMLTLNGVEVAMLVPVKASENWHKPTLKDLLMCDWARTDTLAPDRSELRKGTFFD